MENLNLNIQSLGLSLKPIVRGKKEYQGITLEGMKLKTSKRVQNLINQIEAENFDEVKKSNMITKVRNGFKVKIGYEKKNEILKDIPVVFADINKGFAPVKEYLSQVKIMIDNGTFDNSFSNLLNSYRERAELGKQKKKDIADAKQLGITLEELYEQKELKAVA
ncbi:MAG: hypothetical protein CL571_00155 [Alphaproteobacteria bacterium]|jgi:hypothetical protein|nr:hypothetical protein [Alphaproteobacteria bacterium]|tara:strand:+ start:2246 stop:2737 length:492 start_codon:yes stop_codon:yes gene_type:complete